jgi:hypothetical protein
MRSWRLIEADGGALTLSNRPEGDLPPDREASGISETLVLSRRIASLADIAIRLCNGQRIRRKGENREATTRVIEWRHKFVVIDGEGRESGR